MDITSVFETVVPGSNPGESTKQERGECFCAFEESKLLGFRQDSNAAVMFQKSFIPYFFETDEAGSQVLISNSHEVWLAQLVTRDRRLGKSGDRILSSLPVTYGTGFRSSDK